MEVLGAISAGFGLFNTCLHAYRLVAKAIEVDADAALWDVLFRIERTRFEVWGRIVGFLDEKSGLEYDKPEEACDGADLDVLLQSDTVRTLVLDIMRAIQKALDDFEGVEDKYLIRTGSSDQTVQTRKGKALRVWESTKTFTQHLRLVVKDKDRVEQLLKTLLNLNNGLENLVSLPQRVRMAKALPSAVLPHYMTVESLDVVLSAPALAQGRNGALNATAHIKRQCIQIRNAREGGIGYHGSESSPANNTPSPTVQSYLLESRHFVSDKVPRKSEGDPLWPFTTGYWEPLDTDSGEKVLVEWRNSVPKSPGYEIPEAERVERQNMLVQLLHESATTRHAEDYLNLDCFGYVEKTGRSDGKVMDVIGFMSRFPGWADATKDPVSLHDLLSKAFAADAPGDVPSLSTRFVIARRVAAALYQLQCSQWLHRTFCSAHVVFFHDKTTKKLNLHEPRVIGLQYSRPDDQACQERRAWQEGYHRSEGVSNWGSLVPYLHPIHLDHGRHRYRRSHDVYALGIILFEIAFWEPAEAYLPTDRSQESVSDRILKTARAELAAEVGDVYAEAVLGCLKGLQPTENEPSSEKDPQSEYDGRYAGEDPEYGLEEEVLWKVVRQIEKCIV